MGVDELNRIFEGINYIKINLVKLGKDRRKKELLDSKALQAKELYESARTIIGQIRQAKEKISDEDLVETNVLIKKISITYKNIVEFVEKESKFLATMSEFDLKIAVNLLPVMDNSEEKTRQLIDAIDLYSSMISDVTTPQLINFILKTRLSANAKVRLESSYATIPDLLRDMKKHLLTRKSDTALQAKLSRAKQGRKTISEFGKELEEIFVDLTIAQADGDDNIYKTLKPINERNAVKVFSDGLCNPKISTIIAARNFGSLKDAIRVAEEEEVPRSENQIMTVNRRGNHFGFRRGSFRRPMRGQFQNTGRFYHNHPPHNSRNNREQSRGSRGHSRGRYQRGRSNYVNAAEETSTETDANYFFRD